MALTTDLITLQQAQDLTGIPSSEPALSGLVSAASLTVAAYVGFPLHSHTATAMLVSPGGPYLWAPYGCLQSITSLEIDGQLLGPDRYQIDNPRMGRILAVGHVFPKTAYVEPSTYPVATQGRPAIRLEATYGFITPAQATELNPADVPADLQVATAMVASELYSLQTQGSNITSLSLGGASVGFAADRKAISPAVKALLSHYKTSKSIMGGA